MTDNNKIVMLPRELIHAHPDNPRKDLGDLTELRESIRTNGIMQNLTVVPDEGDENGYMILIGHRRFAASEGILDRLPCVVVKVPHREQVGIMLAENMQREDLTYIEQAHGFQMMMDLGDTVETIAEKTGFSKTTVKHRLAINELDPKALEEVKERFQPTISDFIALEKVKDIEKRNEILSDSLNSQEIQEAVEDYFGDLKREENTKKYIELLSSLGWKETKEYFYTWGEYAKYKEITGLSKIDLEDDYNDENIKAAAASITEPVCFKCDGWYITFAIKKPAAKKEKKKSKAELLEEKRRQNEAILNEKRIEMCDCYIKTIIDISDETISKLSPDDYKNTISDLCKILMNLGAKMVLPDRYYNIKTNVDITSLDLAKYDLIVQLMIVVWEHLSSSYENKLVTWNYTKNTEALKAHQDFYKVLNSFGLRLEKGHYLLAVINGTSVYYSAEVK